MKNKILHFIKTKGYYLVLAFCVLAVGTISFISYRSSQQKKAETPLLPQDSQNVEKVEENVAEAPDSPEEQPQKEEAPKQEAAPAEYKAPLKGELIAHYSPDQPVYSYTLKDWRVHCGIDIAAEEGAKVMNVCDGAVESVIVDDLTGKTVTVRHTDGKVSRYASLGDIAVTEGQVVACGETIGTVGRSMLLECGETDHLHYELWQDDKTIDPSFLMEQSS